MTVAKTLMIQGTMSSVGKSMLVTALCRIFARRGVKVAPFKAQNMSNNAGVCEDGGEIGRAQYTQALACGIQPTVQMNPILLKPEADMRSQVVVNGRVWETLPARNYYERKQVLWSHVTTALDTLRDAYDLIIIEGAGSPVELNLKHSDIVNMAVAQYANASVLLAGDIDRGGIFAQLLGTLHLFSADERGLVKGFLVNKFRGDPTLFDDGITILQVRSGIPVLGVIPYIVNHGIPEEDAVAIEAQNRQPIPNPSPIDIALIALPRIANFYDFDPLSKEAGVQVRYVSSVDELGTPSAVIIPGTKSTIADLNWLRETGLATAITHLAGDHVPVVGICGGYQMLGKHISDPQKIESDVADIEGLGLLSGETNFLTEKTTQQTTVTLTGHTAWLADLHGQTLDGYEIHMGQTTSASNWLSTPSSDMSADGRIWGCYLHGLFANDRLRWAWLRSLGWRGQEAQLQPLNVAIDRLADVVEAHVDMAQLDAIIGL